MGCVGSKEEIMAKAQSGLAAAKSYGASGFAELKELAECYNPLQAGGDPNSRCVSIVACKSAVGFVCARCSMGTFNMPNVGL